MVSCCTFNAGELLVANEAAWVNLDQGRCCKCSLILLAWVAMLEDAAADLQDFDDGFNSAACSLSDPATRNK